MGVCGGRGASVEAPVAMSGKARSARAVDVKRLARFTAPGHGSEGRGEGYRRSRGAGWDYLHCVVDDHTRLAYVELHRRDSEDTNIACLKRALVFFAEQGLAAPRGDDRWRDGLQTLAALQSIARQHRRTTHHHPALHPTLERQSRTLHPNIAKRMAYAHR